MSKRQKSAHKNALLTKIKSLLYTLSIIKPFISKRRARRLAYQKMLDEKQGVAQRFETIYRQNLWGDSESASGRGSSLETTKNVRQQLPKIFIQHQIKSFLDAPCGDFNWMRSVLPDFPEISYVGGDIVGDLIIANNDQFGNERIEFTELDITKGPLPDADLMMVRDCLFHLSYADIRNFLQQLDKSNVRLLLTSSNYIENQNIQNTNIVSGDFRPIDLFKPPLNFPEKWLEVFDDSSELKVRKKTLSFFS